MPIYEYLCHDCGEEFEVIRSMKDSDAPMECQRCKSAHTSRMISTFNAQSGGRVVAGSGGGCGSCSSGACSTCGSR